MASRLARSLASPRYLLLRAGRVTGPRSDPGEGLMRPEVRRKVSLVLSLLGMAAAVEATTAIQLTDADMVADADLIVTGECQAVQSDWIGSDLVTIARVAVGETLKGESAATVDVVLPGGIDLDRKFPIASTWPGAPTMQPGEEVFLFLATADDPGHTHVVGFSQGKFSIQSDARGSKVVSRDLKAIGLLRDGGVTPGDQR